MTRTSDAVEAVAEVALSAFSAPYAIDGFPRVLQAVQRAIGADTAGFYVHERRGWTTPLYVSPDEVWKILPFGRMPTSAAVAIHPGIRHCVVDTPRESFSVTDLVPERTWLESGLVKSMSADWGRNFQFAIPVAPEATGGDSHAWVLGRMSSNFGARDHEVAAALAPLLNAVARHRSMMQSISIRSAAGDLFTQRETIVLELQAEGLGALGVASRLGISPRTAQKHAEHIYRKLGVSNRHDAIRAWELLGTSTAPASSAVT